MGGYIRCHPNRRFFMNQRFLMSTSAALAIVFAAVLMTPAASGQHVVKAGTAAVSIANDKSAGKYVVKKTPDGVPDLQGYWTNNTYTSLERPNGVTKEFYTPAEAVEA